MASAPYNKALQSIMDGTIDLDTANLWVALVMTNTTADTENDGKVFVGDLTTLDECDGANYVRKKLASKVITLDDATDSAFLDAADVAWTALGNGTRAIQGIVVYVDADDDGDPADDAANRLVTWLEFSASQNPGGSLFTVIWAATGLLKSTRV